MDFLDKAAGVPSKTDLSQAKSRGAFGMIWVMGNPEVKEGLGVLLKLTKGLAILKAR